MLRNYLAAALIALASTARAEEARVIDLEQAIAMALEHNSALLQAEVSADLSRLDFGDARSRFLPSIALGASGLETHGRGFSEREGRIVDDTVRSASLFASTGVTLFNGFGDLAALRQAGSMRKAGQLDLGRARETVVSVVATAFFGVLGAREQMRVQRENLVAEIELERQIQVYVEGGSRTRADLYTQQVIVANAQLAVTEAERTAELARMELLEVLGASAGAPHEIAESGADVPTAEDTFPVDPNELVAQALARRQDLAAEQARVEAAEQGVRIAGADRWPSVTLGAGYGSGYTDASALSDREQLEMNRGSSIGIEVALPLFDGGRIRRAVRRAELQTRSARLSLDDALREVERQVRTAHLDYRIARQQLALAEKGRTAAGLALDIAKDRYRLGIATLVELSQSRAAHTQAESTLVNGRYNLRLRQALLDYATGGLESAAAE